MNDINTIVYWGLGIAIVILSLATITIYTAFASEKAKDYKANFDNIAGYFTRGMSTVAAVLAGALIGLLLADEGTPRSIQQLTSVTGGFIAALTFGVVIVWFFGALKGGEDA